MHWNFTSIATDLRAGEKVHFNILEIICIKDGRYINIWSTASYSDRSCFVQSVILWNRMCKSKSSESSRAWQQWVFILCPERDKFTQTEWERFLSSLCQSPSFQGFPANSVVSYTGQAVNLSFSARYPLHFSLRLLQMRKLFSCWELRRLKVKWNMLRLCWRSRLVI